MNDQEKRVIEGMREQAELWSGLSPHDEVAAHQAGLVYDVWRGVVSLRGTLSFEDQPADFDVALRNGKRVEANDLGK